MSILKALPLAYARKNVGSRLGHSSVSSFSQELSDSGLDIIRLRNDCVDLVIVPAVGGKILEMVDRRSGRNWLWRNPHIPLARTGRDADFNRDQDCGGWDEVLLSIKPGKIRSASDQFAAIPDHGDVVGCEWSVEELRATPAGEVICDMVALGVSAPYRFRRRIRLPKGESAVEMDYSLINDGDDPLPCYWCAHPILAIEPDAIIDLPRDLPLRVEDEATRASLDDGAEQRWPMLRLEGGESVDLSQSFAVNDEQRAFASKIFVRSPDTGIANVSLGENGAQLTFKFDPIKLPWLGLWINNNAWSGCGSEPYMNLGFEPTTSPYDCVNKAIENDAVPWLDPGERRDWSLRVEMQT